ncbi:MAG: hypothetical protein SCK57_08590 [Bacillota bacterium]|nr:hypothetical protein [Bacillota bacterium]MDW7677705.1 hypothetical protein [Bacillota bacterium]
MGQLLPQIIPVILLLIMGKIINMREWFSRSTMGDLKRFTVNATLPAVLFLSFFNMELQNEYYLIFILTFVMLYLFFFTGKLLNRIPVIAHPILPYMTSGMAFGFIGIPFFLAVYGIEELGSYAIWGVGHEVFLWMFLFPWIRLHAGGKKFNRCELGAIVTSPTIMSIVAGILLNRLGLPRITEHNILLQSILNTLNYLAALTTPLILIIVGYDISVKRHLLKDCLKIITVRMAIMMSIGYAFKVLVINQLIPPEPIFNHAFFTFLILPPPLVVPMYISYLNDQKLVEIASSTIALSTILSVLLYSIVVLV